MTQIGLPVDGAGFKSGLLLESTHSYEDFFGAGTFAHSLEISLLYDLLLQLQGNGFLTGGHEKRLLVPNFQESLKRGNSCTGHGANDHFLLYCVPQCSWSNPCGRRILFLYLMHLFSPLQQL